MSFHNLESCVDYEDDEYLGIIFKESPLTDRIIKTLVNKLRFSLKRSNPVIIKNIGQWHFVLIQKYKDDLY